VVVIDIEKLIIMILGLQLPSHKLTPPLLILQDFLAGQHYNPFCWQCGMIGVVMGYLLK